MQVALNTMLSLLYLCRPIHDIYTSIIFCAPDSHFSISRDGPLNTKHTSIYFYWLMTTTTNPTIIRPHISLTDWRHQRQTQPQYDHIVCLLTGSNDKSNYNTTTYCVYWLTKSTTNPTIIVPHTVFTDEWQQRNTQP